jgi:hypothetical protein
MADTTKGANPDGLLALWRRSAAVDGAPARGDADSLLKTSLIGSRDFYPYLIDNVE